MVNLPAQESATFDTDYAILPMRFIEDLYKILLSFNAQFVTPDELSFLITDEIQSPKTIGNIYKREYASWQKKAPRNKFTILLLHDCDYSPHNTIHFLEYEKSLSIRSTTAVYVTEFNKNEEKPFPIDYSRLALFQQYGFCFSYHWNCATSKNFDPSHFWTFFDSDIDFLNSKGLEINYYSSHGAITREGQKNNHEFFPPARARHKLLSTHNRYAFMGLKYSDGAFEAKPEQSDIRNFLFKLAYGERHIILLHPCRYGAQNEDCAKKLFPTHPYIEEYWKLYRGGDTSPYWKEVLKALSLKKISQHIQ